MRTPCAKAAEVEIAASWVEPAVFVKDAAADPTNARVGSEPEGERVTPDETAVVKRRHPAHDVLRVAASGEEQGCRSGESERRRVDI